MCSQEATEQNVSVVVPITDFFASISWSEWQYLSFLLFCVSDSVGFLEVWGNWDLCQLSTSTELGFAQSLHIHIYGSVECKMFLCFSECCFLAKIPKK